MRHYLPLGGSTGEEQRWDREEAGDFKVCNIAKKSLYDAIQLLGADV